VGEQREVAVDDLQCIGEERRARRQRTQLQREALGAIASADTRRLEALHVLERDVELVGLDLELRWKKLGDLLERRREIAVVVERIDQCGDDMPVAKRQVEQRELPVQMIAQR